MAVYRLGDEAPSLHPSAWVAESATVTGRVSMGEDASVWFGAAVRGDNEPIRIGARSNVQENAVLHSDPGFPLVIGENVTVGHQATLHGCTVGPGTLIGIGAVVMNGATIGANSLVGAGALVTEGKAFPDGSLIMGVPAKAVKALEPEQIQRVMQAAQVYVDKTRRYKKDLHRVA